MAFSFFMRKKPKESVSQPSSPVVSKKPLTNRQTDDGIFLKKNEKQSDRPITIKATDEKSGKNIYAFIDASNLFWGGRESIGFKINYKKLLQYLKNKFGVSKAFYYGGLRIFDFDYSILDNKDLDLHEVEKHLNQLKTTADPKEVPAIERSLNKINFYRLLESYGFVMKIKPAKVYYAEDDENEENPLLKANCDVDMTFDMMRYIQQYQGIVAMTGDGDFAAVLSYLKAHDRSVKILSRWARTAKEIRVIAGDDYVDLERLRRVIEY